VLLSDHTTLRLGGPAGSVVEATTEDALVAAVRDADARGEPVLLLGGGSNLVVADDGFAGTVARIASRGTARDGDTLHVAAGEPWDDLVAHAVAAGLAGIECLSGIPGLTGATPIQNVGAYGQEVSDTIMSVRAYDRRDGETVDLAPEDCGFGYRTSAFKRDPGRFVVLRVSFALHADGRPRPIRYGELARAVGADPSLADVRSAVLALRRAKGMVLDAGDPDTASAGSFFTNPILDAAAFAALRARAGDDVPGFPEPGGAHVKTSAAWLIARAGFAKGYGDPAGIAISTKHVLALTNRGAGTTEQLVALARELVTGVEAAFGVTLHPEPVFAGHAWAPTAA
jgi:UDP-N-acetylmuramate dehydrogenase